MGTFWTKLMTVDSPDEQIRRRGQNLIILASGWIILALVLLAGVAVSTRAVYGVVILLITTLFSAGALLLGRRGAIWQGSGILIGETALAIYASMASKPDITTPFYLALGIMVASATLRPAQIWATTALVIGGLLAVMNTQPATYFQDDRALGATIGSIVVLITLTALGSVIADGTERALTLASAAGQCAEQASRALTQANSGLEATVASRTSELAAALAQQQAQAESLQASLATQRQLNLLISDLALPIIPIRSDVLVAPLIGNLDSARAQQLLGNVLQEVEQRRAKALVLDVTGVPVVDSQTAAALIQVASAINLLGAQTILVGIRPEVAQALVTLGVTFDTISTAATLQEGLTLVR